MELPETARLVVVAFVVVAFLAVKSWKVEEPVAKRLPKKPVPETSMAVDEENGKRFATTEVE
jgi:hypothetical protein